MSKGFTFIELIIATGILLSLVGFGTASYVNFNERQILEQAAKDLKNNIRVAQQNAISGVKDNDLCDPDGAGSAPAETFRGWCMSPRHDDAATSGPYDSYQIYGVCDTDESDTTVKTFPLETGITPFNLPDGIILTTRSFSPSVAGGYEENSENARTRFNVFGNDVRLADDTYTKIVYCLQGTFPSLGLQDTYQITINRSGEINDDGFVDECTST